jgi:hypothetical protein
LALVIVFAIALTSLWGGASNNSSSTSGKVSWTPTSLNTTVSAGDSKKFSVSFLVSENLSNLVLRVVPELQPYVQVVPSHFIDVNAGESVAAEVIVAIPATILPQSVSGVIQLRSTSGNVRTIPQPLPMTLNITWATYSNTQAGVQMSYPDFGLASKVDAIPVGADGTLLDVKFKSGNDTNFVSGFGLSLFNNQDQLTLSDWFHKYIDPKGTLVTSGAFTSTRLANGMDALVLSGQIPTDYLDEFGPVMPIYTISQSRNTVCSIVQSQASELDKYGLTPDQIREMLLEIITSLKIP